MPQVPRLDTRRVGPNIIRQPQTNAAAQPFAGVAAGLGAAADIVQKEVEKARQRGNEIRLNSAEVKVRELRNRILNDREKGVLNQQGENSFTAPEEAESAWRRGLSEIGAELTDPDVQAAFRARAGMLGVEMRDTVNRHVSNQMVAVGRLRSEQLLKDIGNSVVGNAANNAQVGVDMVRAEEVLRGQLRSEGILGDTQDSRVAAARSVLRIAQVKALAGTDPTAADTILKNHLEEIAPSERQATRDYVENASVTVQSQRIAADLMSAFPKDERAALAEARRFEGKLGDEAVRRVEALFADERRLFVQDRDERRQEATAAVEQNAPLSVEQRAWFLENDPETIRALENRQRQKNKGVADENDWEWWTNAVETLATGDLTKIRDINLAEAREKLTDQTYAALVTQRANLLRGGATRANAGITDARLPATALQMAVQSGVLSNRITSVADLKKSRDDREVWNRVFPFIMESLTKAQAAQPDIPLTESQQLTVIQGILDDRVMTTTWGRMVDGRMIPRAALGEGQQFRKLTAEERATLATQSSVNAPLSERAAARARELRQQNPTMTLEQARAVLLREGLLTPNP